MEPTQELVDEIYAEKVRRARNTPIDQKLTDGPRLFALACEAARAGIRAQHPDASDQDVERMLDERLAIAQRLEEATRG